MHGVLCVNVEALKQNGCHIKPPRDVKRPFKRTIVVAITSGVDVFGLTSKYDTSWLLCKFACTLINGQRKRKIRIELMVDLLN